MRPQRLELDGFTAFREPVTIDFSDADLFALVGPTGAGKSSIIDAMCFALYGSVPRLDRRSVAPVVSAGALQARVRLDFSVGTTTYTATRVVRRTATGGATTKEARLECGQQVLAGNADEVTRAVEGLLGIGFEQFTTCVVLPQGEFARFLHDTPRERQDLLVRLLELGVYADMRSAANQRRAAADGAAELIERDLQGLAGATEEALATAAGRVDQLQALVAALDEVQPRIDALGREAADCEQAAVASHRAAARLQAVAVPDDLPELAGAVDAAQAELAEAEGAAAEAEKVVTAAEAELAELPEATDLAEQARQHREAAELGERITRGQAYLTEAAAEEARTAGALQAAEERATAAVRDRDATRAEHAAHALAADLRIGQPCPVCEQPVAARPRRPAPKALADADRAVDEAEQQLSAARNAHTGAAASLAKAEHLLEELRLRLEQVGQALRDAPDAEAVTERQRDRAEAEERLADARRNERRAREAVAATTRTRDRAAARRDGAWSAFDAARDAVADLSGVPPVDRTDLVGSWAVLAAWAGEEVQRQQTAAGAAESAATAARRSRDDLVADLRRRCTAAQVPGAGGDRPRDSCADALARARADHERLGADLRRRTELDEQLAAQREAGQVAGALGQHLRADRFEQWLLDEALTQLAAGASVVLRQLSAGQYSLAIDPQRGFTVVDHGNADERRPARTLSGGETFLASLALALTLASHLTDLSTISTPRLESIFLDEGFGSLDAATLDVVAAALEELGAGGRTVGLVTHVRELGERMPVRFEVARGPSGASVRRHTL